MFCSKLGKRRLKLFLRIHEAAALNQLFQKHKLKNYVCQKFFLFMQNKDDVNLILAIVGNGFFHNI